MDVKDLRTEPALRERNNDGSKYTQGGVTSLQSNRNKLYQDIGSSLLAKTEGVPVRPCAVIGPDRVVPPLATNDAFLKKGSVEPWPSPDNGYRRPPDYPHRLHQNPVRNISPRQTFQENMQRINVPPTYNVVRHSDSANFNHIQDRSVTISKNAKPNMAPEAKYCDVPYAINANETKNARDSEMYVSSVNSQLTRSAPHVWPPGSVNVNAPRTYSVSEQYQYSQYASCAGQRPPVIPMPRPHRASQEDPAYIYPDHYYRDAIGRLKPYPPIKERCPQPRYEYVGNYGGQFHPPAPIQPLKYDIPKTGQTHPYPIYPHYKYVDNRVPDHTLEGYQRSTTHQPHYNLPFRTQVIHPPYAQVPASAPQKVQPYPPDGSGKSIPSNKLHYDASSKMYIEYENPRTKPYPMTDNYYVSEMNRIHSLKNQMVMPNYSPLGMRAMPSQQYYLKDNTQMKPFEYMPTFRNFDPHLPGNPLLRHAPQFSPNTLAISPTDSTTSIDTSQTHGTSQEDCGYVSQSSTTSVRSIDSGMHRLPNDYYKRHDFRYGPIVGSSHSLAKTDLNSKDSKQKQIDVRQFLQMWNEGEEENNSENSKEIVIQTGSSDPSHLPKHPTNTEDQLYVLGLVNVSSEDLSKYEHIEKISKLPENIKGYNNLELFSRFEEAMESCNTTTFKTTPKEYQNSSNGSSTKLVAESLSRPVSPLDVEAKISQSVIHKEVGCNFEIKPCSPKMLNVEIAAPAQNILGERMIEKVANPLSKIVKSPLPMKSDESQNCHSVMRQDNVFAMSDNPSCKMIRSPFSSSNMDSVKTNYTLQDLEINSGVCLASLPRLDNEIELNFPEVNQQFINANKKDGISTTTNCHQITLQEHLNLLNNKEDKSDSKKIKIMQSEFDKTFSKLSKYRKSKTSVTDSSENKNQSVRTDSVIIKNPENIENKMLGNSPINLSSQSSQWYNSPPEPNEIKDNELALDFSLNKSANDLTIIETEKENLVKQFQTNHSHLSCGNVLPIDANASCHESIDINDFTIGPETAVESIKTDSNNASCILSDPDLSSVDVLPKDPISYEKNVYTQDDVVNSKEVFAEFIQTDPNISKVQNNQELEIKPVAINIKSAVMKKNTDTSISDNTCSDSLVFENKHYGFEAHTIVIDEENVSNIHQSCRDIVSEKSQESLEKYCTDENTMMPNSNSAEDKNNWDNRFEKCGIITTSHSDTARNKDIENMKQCFRPEEKGKINKSELLITSQDENDFEHDEISASLEKLFRDSNDETSLPKMINCSSKISDSKSVEKIASRQSKELYSPWIQKLITYSEGSCSHNELSKKQYVKSIFDPDDDDDNHFEKSAQSHIAFSKDALEQKDKIEYNEIIASTPYIKTKKSIIKNATNDLTIDSRSIPVSNVLHQTSDSHADSMKDIDTLFSKKENQAKLTTLIENHDVVAVKKICVEKVSRKEKKRKNLITNDKERNSECVGNTSKRKFKIRKLAKKLFNNDVECTTNTNSKIDTNNCKNNKAKKVSGMLYCEGTMCDLESVEQNDLTSVNTKYVSDFLSDYTEKQSQENNNDTYVVSGICNRVSDSKLDVDVVQDDSNETVAEDVLKDVLHSSSLTEHHISDNSCKEKVIESISVNNNKDISEISMSRDICINDSAALEKQSNLSCENLSKSDCGMFTKHHVEKSVDKYIIANVAMNNNADIIDNKMVPNERSNIVIDNDQNLSGELSESAIDNNYTDHGTEKPKNLEHLDQVTKHSANEANIPSDSLNIPPRVLNDIDIMNDTEIPSSRLSIGDSASYQVNDNSPIEELVEKCNIYEVTEDFLNESKLLDTDRSYDVVSHENRDSCSSKISVSNNCTKQQLNENQNKDSGIENETKTPSRDLYHVSKTSDSLEVACTDTNPNQEDTTDCDSDITENFNEKDFAENTFKKLDVKSRTLGSDNFICKKDMFPEDQLNSVSSRASEDFIGSKLQEIQGRENITESVCEAHAEDKGNCSTDKPETINMQVENTNKGRRRYIDHLFENKNESSKNIFQESFGTNKVDRKKTKLYCGNEYARKPFSNSNFEGHSTNINDNIEPASEDKIEEQKCTDVQTVTSSGECDNKNLSSEPNSLFQENMCDTTLSKMTDCVSEQWIEDFNERKNLSNEDTINATHDEDVCCDNNRDSIQCDPVVENNLVELDNHLSNKHNTEIPVQESPVERRPTLKRSFSDSALNKLKNRDTADRHLIDNTPMWPPKRKKMYEFDDSEQQEISENFCNFIHNRRNSISSYYNAENVSFCILIDNDCILAEENEGEKICFAEVSEDCITEINTADVEDSVGEVICSPDDNQLDFSDSVMLDYDGGKSIQEAWLDDVACVETVVTDDNVEEPDKDVLSFSRGSDVSNYNESGFFNSDMSQHNYEANFASEDVVRDNTSEFENTYRSLHGDDRIMLYDEEPHYADRYNALYSGQCLEQILSKSYHRRCSPSPTSDYTESTVLPEGNTDPKLPENKENIYVNNIPFHRFESNSDYTRNEKSRREDHNSTKRTTIEFSEDIEENETSCSIQLDNTPHVPESSVENLFSYKKDNDDDVSDTKSSSSTEVSSTTFEEKSSSILLKITNYNGSRVSEINEISHNKPRCKFTESKDYSNSQGTFPKRPLMTKAAQKYIPPLKESIRDLKVKLALPQQRLLKLKQLKLLRTEPKLVKQTTHIPKKQKPKLNFEDVLKNIDEVQIKMHKQNSRKNKNVVPKVVIKKNVNGSHYTSSSSKEKFNPDLTGRKWQPWVFIERNRFIDNMAMRNKTKAIFSYRKNAYVLIEQFKKYKSVSNNSAKFVITQPKLGDSSKGQLKYTIRLKHS